MIKPVFTFIVILFLTITSQAQNLIEWTPEYRLTKDDFQAVAPNSGQIQSASGSFFVEYEMGGINLIATRNLNKNIKCYFQKDASYFDEGTEEGTTRLLKYQQLIFNLYELQARNLRKKFFTERGRLLTKGPSVLHQEVSAEHARLISEVESDTFNGTLDEEINRWNKQVLEEIEKLSDFCKECKPKKKKKK